MTKFDGSFGFKTQDKYSIFPTKSDGRLSSLRWNNYETYEKAKADLKAANRYYGPDVELVILQVRGVYKQPEMVDGYTEFDD